jgi:CubicO group peptidase (beta-lactamase class C family)
MRQECELGRVPAKSGAAGRKAPSAWTSGKWATGLLVVTLLVSGALSGCGTSAPAPTPTMPPTPTPGFPGTVYWPTKEWRTSAPEEQGIDSAKLLAALKHVDDEGINLRSMTVIRNGYIVLEAYYQPWTADHTRQIYSVTKSVTGALVGIAIEDGYIKDVNQPVLSYFPDRTIKNRDANKEAITIEDLLSLQPGLDCADDKLNGAMEASENWVQFTLDLPMASPPGEKLVYCTAGHHVLSAILTRATGTSTKDYAQSSLFDPLGIKPEDFKWWSDPQDITLGGYGLEMKPRDMAKLGLLLQRGGKWEDRQVIPEEWVAASSAVHSYGDNDKNYGYTLWVYPTHFAAEGMGEQKVQVVNDRDMVVVITAAIDWKKGPAILKLLDNYILPTASADGPLPPNLPALAALRDKVKYLAHPEQPVPKLPEIAARVSGKTYVIDENPSGWKSLRVRFEEGKPEALATLVNAAGQNLAAIGLDNVYRVTDLPDGNTVGLRGWWDDEDTFVIRQLQTSPDLEEIVMRMDFAGDELNVSADEVILDTYSIDMHGVAK